MICFHTFSMYHKWGVKTGFTFALQFFMLISDGLGGVSLNNCLPPSPPNFQTFRHLCPRCVKRILSVCFVFPLFFNLLLTFMHTKLTANSCICTGRYSLTNNNLWKKHPGISKELFFWKAKYFLNH